MGPVSGFVFEGDETVYVAGDTIWYEPVEETLDQYEPDLVVLNGGEAQFDQGEPITMGVEDINAVREATDAEIVVVHVEAINHACCRARNCGQRQRMYTFPRTASGTVYNAGTPAYNCPVL